MNFMHCRTVVSLIYTPESLACETRADIDKNRHLKIQMKRFQSFHENRSFHSSLSQIPANWLWCSLKGKSNYYTILFLSVYRYSTKNKKWAKGKHTTCDFVPTGITSTSFSRENNNIRLFRSSRKMPSSLWRTCMPAADHGPLYRDSMIYSPVQVNISTESNCVLKLGCLEDNKYEVCTKNLNTLDPLILSV